MKRALKALRRPLARLLAKLTSTIAPALLALPPARFALNRFYERCGPVAANVFAYLFSGARPRGKFLWELRIAGRTLSLPVTGELQRSWTDALVWRWPPALPMRAFVEWYLADPRASGADGEPPVLLDVGANDGLFTYPFAANGWRCFALEPQETCIRQLQRVARVNDFAELTAVQAAVGAGEADAVDFFVSESSWYSSVSRDHVEKFEPARRISVPGTTIDSFTEQRDLAPRCIKVDVEGAELDVVSGARRTLERYRPEIVIEVDSERGARTRIWNLLAPLGYRFFVLESRERPLSPVLDLEAFLAAQSEYDHADLVISADEDFWARLESSPPQPPR